MNEKEIKRNLEDRGLKVADLARHMQRDFPSISVSSADNMLRQLIAGQRWYPNYARWLNDNYSITVDQPLWLRPVRERMKLAA